jgi:hypothetical protein
MKITLEITTDFAVTKPSDLLQLLDFVRRRVEDPVRDQMCMGLDRVKVQDACNGVVGPKGVVLGNVDWLLKAE